MHLISQGIDIRQLVSLVPPDRINETARVVEEEMFLRIERLKEKIDSGAIEEVSNGMPYSLSG